MKVKESLKQGKHTSKKFFIIEFICIVVTILSVFIMSDRIEKEKPNATDLSQNGAIGTEAGKYVYLQIDGLSDEIAIGPDDLRQIAIDFFNEGLDDEQKITVDQFEDYFGSVLLDTSENPVDVSLELILVLISVITLFVTIIIQICNKVIRIKTFKYLEKNSYEKELEKQLEDNVEETFFNDKLIVTKDFLVDTTGETFVAVKFSDIKWIYTHRLKYYGVVSISNNIIILLNDGKTQFQCLDTKGKISDEFEKAFDKICDKLPNDSLKGYTQENIIEFKEFKKNLKSNI